MGNHTGIYEKYGTAVEITGNQMEIYEIHKKCMKIEGINEENIDNP
jgi:hypothetical protein